MVASSVRQTEDVLSKINKPKPPKTKQANQALCRVICTKVEPCIRTQLDQLTTALGCEDGCQALLLMQTLFADKDDEDCNQNAENTLKTVTLRQSRALHSHPARSTDHCTWS